MNTTESNSLILASTQHWLARAVIGLNLCPYAKSVYTKGQVRYVVSTSTSDEGVLSDLEAELVYLANADPAQVDTSLLIVSNTLKDFFDYNCFLVRAQRMLKIKGLAGILQIASFHPHYQFSDRGPDDIENYTNRAPYPILHLLRESSIDSALDSCSDPASIYERNQETLRRLGLNGWHDWLNNRDHD